MTSAGTAGYVQVRRPHTYVKTNATDPITYMTVPKLQHSEKTGQGKPSKSQTRHCEHTHKEKIGTMSEVLEPLQVKGTFKPCVQACAPSTSSANTGRA